MYRRPKELKYRRRKSRIHSTKSQHSGRTTRDVAYKDLSQEEYEIARWKCNCTRCQDGKRHKWKRQEKVDPFEGGTPNDILDEILWDEVSPNYVEEMSDFYVGDDETSPYDELDLEFCEEIGLCLREDYDNLWNYSWPCGNEFKED